MASNPIQKKVRNARLLGALVTLLITGSIIAFLLMQLNKITKEQEKIQASYREIYTLKQDVKSGDIITPDMLQKSTAQIEHIPSNAPSATTMLEKYTNYAITDNQGNSLVPDPIGVFLPIDCEYTEIYEDENGYYTYSSEGQKETITGINPNNIYKDEVTGIEEKYIIRKATKKTRVYKEDDADEYYILVLRGDINGDNIPDRVKQNIKIFGTPLIAKIDMGQNTVLTFDMISKGTPVTEDVRKQEYNSIILPTDLVSGEYIDIRLQMPSGQDFIVISKKTVEIPTINGMDSLETIKLELSEDEILTMSCAIVEAYRINGSKLYATKYVEPGMQEAAIPTYPINGETVALIKADPNVTTKAMENLTERYNVALRNEHINKELGKEENSQENVTNKMNESITKTQEERQEYLESLATQATQTTTY